MYYILWHIVHLAINCFKNLKYIVRKFAGIFGKKKKIPPSIISAEKKYLSNSNMHNCLKEDSSQSEKSCITFLRRFLTLSEMKDFLRNLK